MKKREDYERYEAAARGLAASTADAGERDYFLARAGLHRTRGLHCEQAQAGPPYGDSHVERARELTETGASVRRSGKGILQSLREALERDHPEDFDR